MDKTRSYLWYYREKLDTTAKHFVLMFMLLLRHALALDLALALELALALGLALALLPATVLKLAFENFNLTAFSIAFELALALGKS